MRTITCPECGGKGYSEKDPSGAFTDDCPVCDGHGEIEMPESQNDLDDLGIPASWDDAVFAEDQSCWRD
jgi:RecJ-like exonuclease